MYRYLPESVGTSNAHGAHGGQQRAFDALGLESQMVASLHVGAGTRDRVALEGPLNRWRILPTEPSVARIMDTNGNGTQENTPDASFQWRA